MPKTKSFGLYCTLEARYTARPWTLAPKHSKVLPVQQMPTRHAAAEVVVHVADECSQAQSILHFSIPASPVPPAIFHPHIFVQ